jgi:hypothetical protein
MLEVSSSVYARLHVLLLFKKRAWNPAGLSKIQERIVGCAASERGESNGR